MKKIAVIGQGYVGLPLAIAFAKHFAVTGFDTDQQRVAALNNGTDYTLEAGSDQIHDALQLAHTTGFVKGYKASCNLSDIKQAQIYIVTVPTPVTRFNAPNLIPLLKASEMLGVSLKGDIVIYESTVYPGCTEEDCVPVLEKNFRV